MPSQLFKNSFLVAFFLALTFSSFAQELKFCHITTEQGLSVGAVNCVLQDSRGFMWFGTQDGLNKYDGYTITVFKHNPLDSNSLSTNFINTLYEDKNGILWIGCSGGLYRFDPSAALRTTAQPFINLTKEWTLGAL